MNKTAIMTTATRAFHKFGLQFKKHSPEILMVTGIAGVVTSAVMACKATTKVDDILVETRERVDSVHSVLEDDRITEEKYSQEDGKKDLAIIYTQTAIKFVKLYGPSVVLGLASITSILASNNIMRKRNVALAAAYAAVDKRFKEYSGRVIDRFGKDLDRELRFDVKAKEVEETVTDENGKETIVKKTVDVVEQAPGYSEYSRIFAEGSLGWTKDPELNKFFLLKQQDAANEKLKSRGYLFLNEVYKMLGYDATKAGQIVGWVYDQEHPVGDNYVDFGLFDIYYASPEHAERKAAFINGHERSIILDFNVDGNILDLI